MTPSAGVRALAGVLAALLSAAGAGCSQGDGDAAERSTREFLSALERRDGVTACELLAEAGVSELLELALSTRVEPPPSPPADPDKCAVVADRLAGRIPELPAIVAAPVRRTVVDGDRASVDTELGVYEVAETESEWKLTRFGPLARAVEAGERPDAPVSITIASPTFDHPALGEVVATTTTSKTLTVKGSLSPPGADVTATSVDGDGRVQHVSAGDGRFKLTLELGEGRNVFRIAATQPGMAPAELTAVATRR